jgi:cytoskeletal protein RodZ
MARNKTQKSGDKKPKRFRRTRWILKWIVMPIVILALAAGAFLLYQYNQYMDGSEPNPKPTSTPTKQYMVDEKAPVHKDVAPTQETGDEKGEEVKVDPNDWK